MHRKLTALVVAVVASLVLSGSALAFDCIRVSSSLQGLQASAGSGKWLPLDFSTPAGTDQTFSDVIEVDITPAQAACFTTAYAATGEPQFFAIGIGVAGPNGVLAFMNENANVLSDNKGIDHLEDSGIFPAFVEAAIACGIPI